ncbi:MAG: S8 family serine peptidase [Candidatus Limnocylindria bacterium]
MSRALPSLLAALVLFTMAGPVAADDADAPGTPAAGEVVPGEVVVKWRDAGRGAAIARTRGLAIVAELGVPGQGMPSVLSTGGRTVDAVIAELRADPSVEYAEPNYVVRLAQEPAVAAVSVNDPKTAGQYSLDQMWVRDAWSLATGGSGIVAVLDTGVQASHPDLAGRVLPGYDFVNNDTNAADDNGHGTWVAGIIAANANDGYGIAGISWSDEILPVKIMTREGNGDTADLTSGIVWAANNGATVINMSVGGFPSSPYVQDAVDYAWDKGVVLVGAAGNNGVQEDFYPAAFPNVVSVSATQVNDEFSNWSSFGPKVDVSAPGASVQTTNCTVCTYADHNTWGDHTYISGTSFAAPNVAGVVALIRARYPSDTPAQVVSRLISTVDDLGYSGTDIRYGSGRVNAFRALGGSTPAVAVSSGDAHEPNNVLSAARPIPLGTATRPSIHPAGDVDVFAVDVPRAGRLDVRVTGVTDTRVYPWNRSALPIDPIVELYNASGTLLKRVDNVWEGGIELASVSIGAPTRIIVRVRNFYANGNRSAYSVTPTYVDTVAPKVIARSPAPAAVNVARSAVATVSFDEPVSGVSSSSFRIRDTVTGSIVPAAVTYDSSRREARAVVSSTLAPARAFTVEVTSAIKDAGGNSTTATSWVFTTGVTGFGDTAGSAFEYDIAWLAERGITAGCGEDRFCPKSVVTREQMASFLSRGLDLPAVTNDFFADDESSGHESDINRLAASGITGGCGPAQFCPSGTVTREQMASFLARALDLPITSIDFFTDDGSSAHEADINRLAASGITGGCGTTTFCPGSAITREQMAAFLHRALGD